jgi:hypothetical protein
VTFASAEDVTASRTLPGLRDEELSLRAARAFAEALIWHLPGHLPRGGIADEEIQKALLESAYRQPVPIMLDPSGHGPVHVLVLLVKPVWVPLVAGSAARVPGRPH